MGGQLEQQSGGHSRSLRTPPLILFLRPGFSRPDECVRGYASYALAPTAAGSGMGALSSLPLGFCWPGWPPLRMSMPPLK